MSDSRSSHLTRSVLSLEAGLGRRARVADHDAVSLGVLPLERAERDLDVRGDVPPGHARFTSVGDGVMKGNAAETLQAGEVAAGEHTLPATLGEPPRSVEFFLKLVDVAGEVVSHMRHHTLVSVVGQEAMSAPARGDQ